MAADSPFGISPDQARADAVASRELIKYHLEFFNWRRNQWAIAAANKPGQSQGLAGPDLKKTIPALRPGRSLSARNCAAQVKEGVVYCRAA